MRAPLRALDFPLFCQFLAETFARQVDTSFVECAGDVGEIDPLKKAMGTSRTGHKLFDFQFSILDEHCVSRWNVFDGILFESQISQSDAFAGCGK